MLDIIKDRLANAIKNRMLVDFIVEDTSSYEGVFVNFQQWMQLRHRDSGLVYHLDIEGERVRIFYTSGPMANYLLKTMELSCGRLQVPNVEEFALEVCKYVEQHHERELDPATSYFES
jgi:hypothetical protein